MSSLIRKRSQRAVVVGVASLPVLAYAGGSVEATGNLIRDRVAEGTARAVGPALSGGTDAYRRYQRLSRAAAETSPTALALQLNSYRIRMEKTGLDESVWNSVSTGGKGLLAMGGPVGMAAAGVWSATVDVAVQDRLDQARQDYRAVLEAGLSKVTQAQFNKMLAENNPDGEETKRFREMTENLLKETNSGDQTKRSEVVKSSLALLFEQDVHSRKAIFKLAKDQGLQAEKLANATSRIADLERGQAAIATEVVALSKKMTAVQGRLDEMQFDRLPTAEGRAAYLRAGGLSHVDATKRQAMLETLDLKARLEVINDGLELSAAGLGVLSVVNEKLLGGDPKVAAAIAQVSEGVKVAQVALAVFAAFTPAGTAMGAFQAIGGMGGGNGMGAVQGQLRQIQATLAQMDKKLDEIIRTLDRIDTQLTELQNEVASLRVIVDQGFARVLRAQFAKEYDDCSEALSNLTWDAPAHPHLPFRDTSTYQRYHYRLAVDGDQTAQLARDCANGLSRYLIDFDRLQALGRVDQTGYASPELIAEGVRYARLQRLYFSYVERYAVGLKVDGNKALRSARAALANPARTWTSLRERLNGPWLRLGDEKNLSCWWRIGPQIGQCAFTHGGATDPVKVDAFFREGPTFTKDGDLVTTQYLHPHAALTVTDLSLTFGPAIFLPARVPRDGQSLDPFITALDSNFRDVEKRRTSVRLLLDNLRLTDHYLSRETLLSGDVLGAAIARDLMNPQVRDDDDTVSSDGPQSPANTGDYRSQWRCAKRWAENPAGLSAPLNALLYDNPRVARTALMLVAHAMAFGDGPPRRSPTAVLYELQRTREPAGRRLRALYAEGAIEGDRGFGYAPLGPGYGGDQDVASYWAPVFRLDKRDVELKGNKLTWAGRGFEVHYAELDGQEASVWVAQTSPGKDDGSRCGGYTLVERKVQLPRGWSLSAGGAVVALPSTAQLLAAEVGSTVAGASLLDRKAALLGELQSLVYPPPLERGREALTLAVSKAANMAVSGRNTVP